MVHCKTQNTDSLVRPKKMLTGKGQSLVQTGQIHTGKGDQGGKKGIILASQGTNYLIWRTPLYPYWTPSLQFAYRANRSVDVAVNMGLHFILQHLDRPGPYVRILYVDFSSAFNTIIPSLLQPKLTQLSVPTSICHWITSFLTDRQQVVRLGKFSSSTRTINTGAPQGCSSPHCSSSCTPMTAHRKTPLSSS